MTALIQSSRSDPSGALIDALRARYQEEGFTFTAPPSPRQLPEFLGSYVPDALASKPGHNIVIALKRPQGSSTKQDLKSLRRLFDGHPDWRLHVVWMGSDDPGHGLTLPRADSTLIRQRIDEARTLIAQGHLRSAFTLSWQLLEATLRSLGDETVRRPHPPGTVIQALAMNGLIDPKDEQALRALIETRNRIVHGDLFVEPSVSDIDLVLSVVETALCADKP